MSTISLCMIIKNEEATIGRCLQSVADLVDEIVIVDTGSSDKTKAICQKYGAKVVDFVWIDDFSAARNFAFSQATQKFIMWLDADDVMSEEDRRKFMRLKKQLTSDTDGVTMDYHLSFDVSGRPQHSIRRYRIVRRKARFRWVGTVHEYLEIVGNIVHSDVAIQHKKIKHDTYRNIKIYENMLAQGKHFTPRDVYYYANELKDHGRYDEAIAQYEKFLASDEGWVEDNINACNKLADCYMKKGDVDSALHAAVQALRYDAPRAETCCHIGHMYFEKEDYHTAVFWYKAALASDRIKPDRVSMFRHAACATWIPHLQLCVCFYRLGSPLLAYTHNEKAAAYIPDDDRVKRNRTFLAPLAAKEKVLLRSDSEKPETDVDAGRNEAEQSTLIRGHERR